MKPYFPASAIVFLLLIFSVSCTLSNPVFSPEPVASMESETIPPRGKCGDRVCTGPENPVNCPADCSTDETQDSAKPITILYFGVMVHLEGWNDDVQEERFIRHAELVRQYASLFEKYGALLTLESKEFTDGCIRWGENVLKEMEDRGHGIGVHADIGGETSFDCSKFTPLLLERKTKLESLGVRVRHVSGNVSKCDWVTASADAGYLFTTGTVAYALMSLPDALRPEAFADCPNPSRCHQSYPEDLAGQMHPWRMNSGSDWIFPSPDGRLVILPSGGGLVCAQEESLSPDSFTKCDFGMEDVDAVDRLLEEAIALVRVDHFNMYYLSWSIGEERDAVILEEFLRRVDRFAQAGTLEWKTLPQIYDLYLQWEGNR